MAAKKTEETTPAVDTSTMNVWAKLLAVRTEFYAAGAKKSGKNLHAEFKYFELEDIVPVAEPLFNKYGLLLMPLFKGEEAIAHVVNTDKPDESIDFTIPLVFIAEPGKFRMNETQAAGAVVTYYRRYLYMVVLDLVESDGFDGQDGSKNEPDDDDAPAPAPKKSTKPVTAEERKAIKEELTGKDSNADEEMIAELKGTLKKLMEIDPEQEEFVQSVAIKTESFKKISKSQCADLIKGVNDMIAAYEG